MMTIENNNKYLVSGNWKAKMFPQMSRVESVTGCFYCLLLTTIDFISDMELSPH